MKALSRTLAAGALLVLTATGLTACNAKSAGSDTSATSGAAAALSIQPLTQIDANGAAVTATAAGTPANPAGDGKATCSNVSIALMAPLTGEGSALGASVKQGAELAIKEHNDANPNCQVTLNNYDDEGDPQKGTQVAPQAIGAQSNVGVVGPVYSGVTKAVGPTFQQANMLLLAVSTNPDLSTNGWGNFFRGMANDSVQGPAVAKWLIAEKKVTSVCVFSDNSDYGIGLAKEVSTALGAAVNTTCSNEQIKTGEKDFSALVSKVKAAAPDAVYYGGYYTEAALIAKQLRTNGVTATFVSDDAANDPQFIKLAGADAKGALLSCPCGPASTDFATKYKAAYNVDPAVYAVEGYDYATIILSGIDKGITERTQMVEYVRAYDGQGVGRHYKWDATGELTDASIWTYEVK
ncbi:branched-chain amino acid ABC transporter substrate-binding protein [Micrococcales bacterium 31B]|nr:branched-chain amino acid ABC transporter substrate-binding protein [Micrococcales bacterium 31B]